jgi:hypothetical protein
MLSRLLSNFWFRLFLIVILLYLILTLPSHAAPPGETATPDGAISGTVTDQATGKPIPGVWVYVSCWAESNCGWRPNAGTDANGYYLLGPLAEGEYTVCFYPHEHVRECYDNWPEGTRGTPVKVGPGQVITGIDAALAPKSHIRGRVSDELNGVGM